MMRQHMQHLEASHSKGSRAGDGGELGGVGPDAASEEENFWATQIAAVIDSGGAVDLDGLADVDVLDAAQNNPAAAAIALTHTLRRERRVAAAALRAVRYLRLL